MKSKAVSGYRVQVTGLKFRNISNLHSQTVALNPVTWNL
jgi:hypothetical protein